METPKTNPEGKVISTCFKIIVPNFSRIRWNASVLIRSQQSDSLASYHQQQQQKKKSDLLGHIFFITTGVKLFLPML